MSDVSYSDVLLCSTFRFGVKAEQHCDIFAIHISYNEILSLESRTTPSNESNDEKVVQTQINEVQKPFFMTG
jgi:hypothetical protein